MKKEIRCAIYTRKSSEEGLEQGFNSLDAQREACEAYIKSQVHEGWVLIEKQYNDGGFSGGTMNRPAFKELMEDIKQDKIDIIVVYKVDRLTRSIMDFAKIIEVFDSHETSFVSITQHFNTTTSMGRLTLNIKKNIILTFYLNKSNNRSFEYNKLDCFVGHACDLRAMTRLVYLTLN